MNIASNEFFAPHKTNVQLVVHLTTTRRLSALTFLSFFFCAQHDISFSFCAIIAVSKTNTVEIIIHNERRLVHFGVFASWCGFLWFLVRFIVLINAIFAWSLTCKKYQVFAIKFCFIAIYVHYKLGHQSAKSWVSKARVAIHLWLCEVTSRGGNVNECWFGFLCWFKEWNVRDSSNTEI